MEEEFLEIMKGDIEMPKPITNDPPVYCTGHGAFIDECMDCAGSDDCDWYYDQSENES
jgi:hypothetical protein